MVVVQPQIKVGFVVQECKVAYRIIRHAVFRDHFLCRLMWLFLLDVGLGLGVRVVEEGDAVRISGEV